MDKNVLACKIIFLRVWYEVLCILFLKSFILFSGIRVGGCKLVSSYNKPSFEPMLFCGKILPTYCIFESFNLSKVWQRVYSSLEKFCSKDINWRKGFIRSSSRWHPTRLVVVKTQDNSDSLFWSFKTIFVIYFHSPILKLHVLITLK